MFDLFCVVDVVPLKVKVLIPGVVGEGVKVWIVRRVGLAVVVGGILVFDKNNARFVISV